MVKASATQHFLNLSDIRDDCMILRNGEIRQAIEVTALNFALKSEQEQAAIVYQYQAFLNALQFPIQIVVQSRQLDLTAYLTKLKERADQTTNASMRIQISDYLSFVSRLISLGNIMEKRFYVIVPYTTASARTRDLFGQLTKSKTVIIEEKEFETAKAKVSERTQSIRSSLASIGLNAKIANNEMLAHMLYTTYNPTETGEVAIQPPTAKESPSS